MLKVTSIVKNGDKFNMKYNKEAIIKTAKEVGRIVFFGGLTALALWVGTLVSSFDPTSLQFIIGTVIGRALDKYIHENEEIKANGVAPF